MVCGLWSLGYGPCAVDYGLWAVEIGSVGLTNSQSLGLWSVGCGLWVVVCGLWSLNYGPCAVLWAVDIGYVDLTDSWSLGLWSVGCGL